MTARLKLFIAAHGDAALGREIVGDCGPITSNAWVLSRDAAQVLLVFGAKAGAWKLPGAHGESDEPFQIAQREASRALGRAACAHHATPFAVCEQTIPVYWNTPAHLHFELIFRFDIPETADLNPALPRGAQWFTLPDAARLDSESRVRLVRKTQPLFQENPHL